MTKTISLFGQDVPITFNLGVQVSYEDITGQPFDLNALNKKKNLMALMMASIIVANPSTTIQMEQLMSMTYEEYTMLDEAVAELVRDWYHIAMPTTEKDEKGGKQKKHAKRS